MEKEQDELEILMWNNALIEVLILTEQKQKNVQGLENLSPRFRLRYFHSANLKDLTDEHWSKIDVLITENEIHNSLLEKAVNLKWVQFITPRQYQDIKSQQMARPDVIITTSEGLESLRRAQHGLSILLSMGLDYCQHSEAINRKKTNTEFPSGLFNKTFGLVGYGATGQILAKLLQPFDPIILAVSNNVMKPNRSLYIPETLNDAERTLIDRLYPVQALPSMANTCDFLLITDTMSIDLVEILPPNFYSHLKKHAIVVDVSQQWDDHMFTIAHAVEVKDIHSAGIDVTGFRLRQNELKQTENLRLFLTQKGSTTAALNQPQIIDLIRQNFDRYINQKELLNLFVCNS